MKEHEETGLRGEIRRAGKGELNEAELADLDEKLHPFLSVLAAPTPSFGEYLRGEQRSDDLDEEPGSARWMVVPGGLGLVAGLIEYIASTSFVSSTISPLDVLARYQTLLAGSAAAAIVGAVALLLFGFGAKRSLAVGLFFCLMVLTGFYVHYHFQQAAVRARLEGQLFAHTWICYEPSTNNPYPDERREPTDDEMRAELKLLSEHFDGIVTFDCTGALARIPAIAREVGFKGVIIGVGVDRKGLAKPAEAMAAAASLREYATAYCLGHNVPNDLAIEDLAAWMAELRARTDRPVSTTARMTNYIGARGAKLRAIGDFYFPDACGHWHGGATPATILEETRSYIRDATNLPQDRPVLLKMVSFPAGFPDRNGNPVFNEDLQRAFFLGVRNESFPSGVHVACFAGVDLVWKDWNKHPNDWLPGEQYVGLIKKEKDRWVGRAAFSVFESGFGKQARP